MPMTPPPRQKPNDRMLGRETPISDLRPAAYLGATPPAPQQKSRGTGWYTLKLPCSDRTDPSSINSLLRVVSFDPVPSWYPLGCPLRTTGCRSLRSRQERRNDRATCATERSRIVHVGLYDHSIGPGYRYFPLFVALGRYMVSLSNQSPDPALASGKSPAGQDPRHR